MIIWLASYPRSGNSLLANLLKHHLQIPVYSIYPSTHTYELLIKSELEEAVESSSQFFTKTHEVPKDKYPAIYIVRDGRDVVLSYAHYIVDKKIGLPNPLPQDPLEWAFGTLIEGTDQFSGWGNHVTSWVEHESTALVIRYEDLIQQSKQAGIIKSIAKIFSLNLPTNAFDTSLPEFSTFHEKYPNFYRQGKAGAWITEMPHKYQLQFWEKYGQPMLKLGYSKEKTT